MIINGKEYKTILFDTNVIREFLFENDGTEKSEQKKESFTNYMNKYLISEPYAILISYYSMIELRPYEDLFDRFLERFNLIPFFMVFPEKEIISEEYNHFKMGVQMELDKDSNKYLRSLTYFSESLIDFNEMFFKSTTNKDTEKFIENLQDIADHWNEQRQYNTKLIQEIFYYRLHEYKSIKNFVVGNIGEVNEKIDLKYFSGARMMLFSQYKKVNFTKKPIVKNDVIDVKISCIVPYVDVVITERQQAEFFRQAKGIIPQMKYVDILTLKDLH